MKTSTWTQILQVLRRANRWYKDTPDRALDQAYDAALRIKAIEDEHFQGGKITQDSDYHSDRVLSYFNSELKKCLKIIQTRLAEFNTSRSILNLSESLNSAQSNGSTPKNISIESLSLSDHTALICEKLNFIDSITEKYTPPKPELINDLSPELNLLVTPKNDTSRLRFSSSGDKTPTPENSETLELPNSSTSDPQQLRKELTKGSETSVLPRSLLRTFGRIRRELNPESEEEVIKNYRKSKVKTIISVRFILLLILVPL
ncbi:MAG: proton extrusion protein PcxA, partial [Cyanobacteriota bacterium]|nr:proton extrusion protein PcxA [Cyanobacteriota bacterium]